MLIARLIADIATRESSLEAAGRMLRASGVRIVSVSMLESHSDVLHLEIEGDDEGALRTALDSCFKTTDGLIIQSATLRGAIVMPALFVSDMDSTMIGQECIDELADYAGLKDKIAGITERTMQGELDFESALRERVSLLDGLAESAIETCLAQRITASKGAHVLVETLKAHDCRTVLVTGGFHHFADRVAEQIGFERVVGNRLEVIDGKLTGALVGPVCDGMTKRHVMQEEASLIGAGCVTMAAGDGANDVPMLEAADYGFAYRAKPKAREASNGWIERGDLTSVLKLLGIPERDWAS